jgi:opacity protein-like surface antigen
MRLRRLSSIVASFSLVIGIAWAGAAVAEPEDHSGFYSGIGAGFGFDNFDGFGGIDIDAAFGLDAWGGYQFNKWIATELQLEYLNGFDIAFIEGQAVTFGANLKVFPLASVLTDCIQPFVMAGPGFTWMQFDAGVGNDLEFSARFGGGIDFYITDNVALQVSSSYVLTTGVLDGLDYISLVAGVQYKF